MKTIHTKGRANCPASLCLIPYKSTTELIFDYFYPL